MAPWRDVRDARRVVARFVDGPIAGEERKIAAAPNGAPPAMLRLSDALEPDPAGPTVYELVSHGATGAARYRLQH